MGTSAEFWLGLQAQYDPEVAREALEDKLEQEVTVIRSADWAWGRINRTITPTISARSFAGGAIKCVR